MLRVQSESQTLLDPHSSSKTELNRSSSYRSLTIASTSDLRGHLQPSLTRHPLGSSLSVSDMTHEKGTKNFDTEKSRPTVHYTSDLNLSSHAPAPSFSRVDSSDVLSSRASSIGTDDEDSDEYDWSGEEDLADEEAKFEHRMGVAKTVHRGWGPKRITTLLFSNIIGSTILAGLLVLPGILVQIYWYKPHPTDHRRYVKQNVQAWLFWAAANIVISWCLAMIIDVIPVLVQLIIAAIWGHVSEHVKTRIEMYDSVKNTVKPVFYAASCWASWVIVFGHIYNLYNTQDPNESRARYTKQIQRVVEFFFFLALVLCAKQMLSHAIALVFHRTAYKDRIESVEETLSVIETLRNYRPKASHARKSPGIRTPLLSIHSPLSDKEHYQTLSNALRFATSPGKGSIHKEHYDSEDGAEADREDWDRSPSSSRRTNWKKKTKKRAGFFRLGSRENSEGHTPEQTEMHRLKQGDAKSSGSPLSTLSGGRRHTSSAPANNEDGTGTETTLVQAAKVIKNAVLHDARNIGGTNIGEGSMSWNISSSKEAKRLARSLYMRFKDRHRNYLLPSDFYPAFPDEASAEAAFRVFDKDNNGDLSRAELKTTVVKVYRERRFLSRSMRDVGVALKTLNQIILLFAMIILFFISLSVFGVKVGDSLTSVYSIGIAASFIFKNSASSAFDAIMFLFVTHPYDTGDRCTIDEEVLVVKKVGLFATVFERSDGTETYYFNSQLFTKFITNMRRSGKTFENLTMQVAWRTPLETLDLLEKLINEWLSTEENRWFDPSAKVMLQHIEFQRYLTLTIGIGHNGNWQVGSIIPIWRRKTAFHAAVQYYCRQLDISFYESPLPITYVNPEPKTYEPSPSPSREAAEENHSPLNVGEDPDRVKPLLGFLPPPSRRSAQLTRARKSKSKKTGVRGLEPAGS